MLITESIFLRQIFAKMAKNEFFKRIQIDTKKYNLIKNPDFMRIFRCSKIQVDTKND